MLIKKLLLSFGLIIFSGIISRSQNSGDIKKMLPDLVKTYQYIHQHPELSYKEFKTSGLLADKMRQYGFKVTGHFGGTGLVAILKNGKGPKILIRTDMDALPILEKTGVPYASKVRQVDIEGVEQPVMHACGHDIHMSVWLGTARYLATHKNEWHGTLMMIAQPAEERGGGADAMLKAGLYRKFFVPDYAIALHVNANLEVGKIAYCPGYAMANVDMARMTFTGRGGHGAYPHKTIDPIVMAAQFITDMQSIVSREISPVDPAVVTVGSIHGGTKGNVIPSQVTLEFTIRSYTDQVRNHLLEAIQRKANATAAAFNVPKKDYPVLKLKDTYTPALYNDPALVDKVVSGFKKIFGVENVIKTQPVMGGEDFSRYGRTADKVPVFMYWLGIISHEKIEHAKKTGEKLPSLHSDLMIPDAEPSIFNGIKAMTNAVITLSNEK